MPMKSRLLWAAGILGIAGAVAVAVSAQAPASPAFEVASIKPNKSGAAVLVAHDGPSFFTALQEQLGLKLEASRGPVDVLVIDHVERATED